MKKTSKQSRKLALRSQTVRALGDLEIGRVQGGTFVDSYDAGQCVGQSFDLPCPEPTLF